MFYASRSMVVCTLNRIFHTFAPFLQSIALRYFLLGNDARFVWDRLKYFGVFADSLILYTRLTDPIVIFYCVVIFHDSITAFNPNYCIGQPFPTYLFQRALGLCFLPRPSLGVGSSILLRSLGGVGLFHWSYHTFDKGNLILRQAVFLVQHLVRPGMGEVLEGNELECVRGSTLCGGLGSH